MADGYPDIADIARQLDDAERDAQSLVLGLSEERAAWRPAPGAWSVSECLDHLATANRVYLHAMHEPAVHARSLGRLRRAPVKPGILGGWFVRTMEPPVKPSMRVKAHRTIVPRPAPSLADAFEAFIIGHAQVRAFLAEHADLDLNRTRFPNPFIRGLRFSLATGLNVISAHERRHLWQAWNVRRAAEAAHLAI